MMLKTAVRLSLLACCSAVLAAPATAQTPAPAPAQSAAAAKGTPPPPPPLLQIEREEVRPGKGAAHAANEAAWAAAYAKAQSPVQWLGMTTVSGSNEAWFLTRHESFAALEKSDASTDANPALSAERDRVAAVDGDLLTRSSTILARYRPGLSYQPVVNLPSMRYMTVDIMRVKAGHVETFLEGWRAVVEAHKTAAMDEHWATYEVESGMPDTTFLFLYARKSLGELDATGPMHSAAGYRDAMGESGRRNMNEASKNGIEMTQTMHFRLRPGMSNLSKEWVDTDAFWAPPAAVPVKTVPKR